MYASFLLKYSKSYLHTCIIFYMFILFCFFNATRADVSHPSYVSDTFFPLSSAQRFFETPRHLCPFLSFLFSIDDFYLFAHFVRHRSSMMNTVRYASAIREREEKKGKRKKKKKGASQISGTDTSGFECICMYAYVCSVYTCLLRTCVSACI